MEMINIRGNLDNLKNAIKKKNVKIGFSGGSITSAAVPHNWPTYIRGWFVNEYPDVMLTIVNSAIGATGSLCGLALAQKEFIDTNCDIVFIEFAVNDNAVDKDERMRTREGLIRKLLAANIQIVLVYTFYSEMNEEVMQGKTPKTIEDMEILAQHYNISSVYMAMNAYDKVSKGLIPFNAWLPDGTHPKFLGSYFYAQPVIEFLKKELSSKNDNVLLMGNNLPLPYNKSNWQNANEISFDKIKFSGAWSIAREVHIPYFEKRLFTYGIGDSLEFDFTGRGLSIIFSYGKTSGLIEYRLDGGEWQSYTCERYWWMPEENFVNAVKFFDDLPFGEHNFQLRVLYDSKTGCTSSDCSILEILEIQ